MIIFGTKGRDRTIGSGDFNCPTCGARRQYEHHKVQSWFTLYFIPVVPLKSHGEHVTCQACNNAFTLDVLNYDPTMAAAAHRSNMASRWRSALLGVACAFGRPNEVQADMIASSLHEIFDTPADTDEMLADCGGIPEGGVDRTNVVEAARALSDDLALGGKEKFLERAIGVMRAGGGETGQQEAFQRDLGAALGLSDAHVRGLMLG